MKEKPKVSNRRGLTEFGILQHLKSTGKGRIIVLHGSLGKILVLLSQLDLNFRVPRESTLL
jgi:hypothetical protein